MEVKKYQTKTSFLILHLVFSRVCREMAQNLSAQNVLSFPGVERITCISPDAVHALQTEAENYVMKYLTCR